MSDREIRRIWDHAGIHYQNTICDLGPVRGEFMITRGAQIGVVGHDLCGILRRVVDRMRRRVS